MALFGCAAEPAPSTITETLPSPTAVSTPTPTSTPPLRYMGNELTLLVVSVEHDIPEYIRKEWGNWIDEDRDCQNTRQEVLIRQSTGPVTYVEEEQCRVASGTWVDPFSEGEFMDPIYLHIDHMVPLANAHISGGWIWSEDKKRQYLNDLSYDGHLIAVRTTVNSSKGDNGPEHWKPPVEGYWCQYAIDWIAVKERWELFASEVEAAALTEMLKTCTPALTLTVIPHDIPQPEPTPSPSPAIAESYDSCEAAEEAGEPRILGSSGPGRGFPIEKVPGARDGDGDGVVCESTSSPTPSAEATPSPTPTIEPTPSPSPTLAESYESCEAAEEAGEPRILGSSGPGRGFPIEKVPGARDGDGDGVVCESTSSPTPSAEATPSPTPTVEPTPSPSPTLAESYDSCEAAEEAGEPRILGSSGPGRGFPIEKVPESRDGDGDGVVCEK